ncbi:MAG: tetratricopeptide repeat protein [Planctomycetes bacterium]|nr:tetratricopeptide repeat protein [Planctomycetota bacterium]
MRQEPDLPTHISDPGGVLLLPIVPPRGGPAIVVSSRDEILFAWEPSDAAASDDGAREIFVLDPSRAAWRPLGRDPAGESHLLVAIAEGDYLIAAAPTGRAAAPYEDEIVLCLRADRSAPRLAATLRELPARPARGADGVEIKWSIADESPLAEAVVIEYSPDYGTEWRRIANSARTAGVFRWPVPPEPRDRHLLRFTACDIAGNRASAVVSLGAEIERELTVRAPAAPAAPLASDVAAPAPDLDPPPSPPAVSAPIAPAGDSAAAETAAIAPGDESRAAPELVAAAAPRADVPPPEDAEDAEVAAANGPRPLNFSGEHFPGGCTRNLYIGGGDRTGVRSQLAVRLIPKAEGVSILVASLPAESMGALIELPYASGEYFLEIAWQDAQGREHARRAEAPITIDCDPPALSWSDASLRARDTVRLSWEIPSETPAGLAEIAILYRSDDAATWREERVRAAALGYEPPGRFHYDWQLSALAEGDWQLAALARDAAGNAAAEPIAGPRLAIDRTPFDLAGLRIPAADAVGLPYFVELALADAPARSGARFAAAGMEPVLRPVRWIRGEGGWRGEIESLPAGSGLLTVWAEDECGNRAERSGEITIRTALERDPGVAARAVPAAYSEEGVDKAAPALLVGRFRKLRARFASGERTRELEAARAALAGEIEAALARTPGDDDLRRALAQLFVHATPPDFSGAAALLARRAGAARGGGTRAGDEARGGASPELLNDLAAIELRLGLIDEAESHILRALASGETALRRFHLGEVHVQRRRFAEAEACFRAALEIGPRRSEYISEYIDGWLRAVACLPEGVEREAARGRSAAWAAKGIVSREEAAEMERALSRSQDVKQ